MRTMPERETAFLSIKQAAERLRVVPSALYQGIEAGKRQPVRVLGKTALRQIHVDAYRPRDYRARKSPRRDNRRHELQIV